MQLRRLCAVLIGAVALQGCLSLPPELRAELECSAPDNFGNDRCGPESR